MIQQLVKRLIKTDTPTPAQKWLAAQKVLTADPLDLVLAMEEFLDRATMFEPRDLSGARGRFWEMGFFANLGEHLTETDPWDHLIYAYVLESTRVVQIFKRVVFAYRTGESLGIPSLETQRWLDATEVLLFGAANPFAAWLSTSTLRQDPEAVRRNAYWRMFGLELGFGSEDNAPASYEKAAAANTGFNSLFEELLFELWQAISNEHNLAGVNQSDNDRIFRIAEQLRFILSSRRQNRMLRREELSAVTALGWADLTLAFNTPVVTDLKAQGSSAGDRLRLIGERVGLAAHGKSAAFFSMAAEASVLLRTLESGIITDADKAWILYALPSGATGSDVPIGAETRRVITEWAAATGRNLKERAKPMDVRQPRLAAVK